jgi:hypothetical protein
MSLSTPIDIALTITSSEINTPLYDNPPTPLEISDVGKVFIKYSLEHEGDFKTTVRLNKRLNLQVYTPEGVAYVMGQHERQKWAQKYTDTQATYRN